MKIKEMGWFVRVITGGSAAAITLWPFGIYVRKNYLKMVYIVNHEKIHWQQQKEFPVIFYLWYFVEWIFRGFYRISFEQEAFDNQNNLEYLSTRKRFAWFKYLKK